MQVSERELEIEARRRLPLLLADLLDEENLRVESAERTQQVDLVAHDMRGHQWLFLKTICGLYSRRRSQFPV